MALSRYREFYPNACYVCHETRNLKRCSRCQMISYCTPEHQQIHYCDHRLTCRKIAAMMKHLGVSHLFEKLRGSDTRTWFVQRLLIQYKIEERCDEHFTDDEIDLFTFPRSCFVCHETRQWLLKNCPDCPAASFCPEHPSSSIHKEDCAKIRDSFRVKINLNKQDEDAACNALVATLFNTLKPTNKPTTMRDFLTKFTSDLNLPEELRMYISEYFTMPLTTLFALEKLEYSRCTELTIHILGSYDYGLMWEIAFHFWPHLKTLNIVLFDYDKRARTPDKNLCHLCLSRGKTINLSLATQTYDVYMKGEYCEPDILLHRKFIFVGVDDLDEFKETKKILKSYSRLMCPVIITTSLEKIHEQLKETVSNTLPNTKIIFDGSNPFNALLSFRHFQDGTVAFPNQFMVIFKSEFQARQKPIVMASPKTFKISSKIENLFYSSVCHVCGATSSELVTCKRCRMISYCGKLHQVEHQEKHRELCKIILGMLNESEAPNLFDKLKTSDADLWLRAKFELLTKARTRIGRDLTDFEMQMFLFPKTCFVCHESDSSVLRSCRCGVHLCKIHKNDEEHKKLCPDLSLAFQLSITERPEITKATVKEFNDGNKIVPMSMSECIDSFIQVEPKVPNYFKIPNLEKFLISDYLTRPLTLLWCLEELNYKMSDTLIIHVIGATNPEVATQKYWRMILYRFQALKTLKIIFIGPEITKTSPVGNGLEFPISSLGGKNFQVETFASKYDDYFHSKSFVKPKIVIGFNLNLYEKDFAIFNNTDWKETIMSLKKIDAPFILTSGSKTRAEKEHVKFCELFEKKTEFVCCEKNPFAGLIPERDYETEKVLYSNEYVIIYNDLYEKKRGKFKAYKIVSKVRNNW